MIAGVGNDLVDMTRLQRLLARYPRRLPQKILTVAEREEFAVRQLSLTYLAGRVAAKEALSKALGTGLRTPVNWRQIAILGNEVGSPEFHFEPLLADYLAAREINKCHLSITHDGGFAMAVVIADKIVIPA
ncbi:holo-ACP synthase [Candidatus Persebacteraceae bacterium Df01]|jgi:holo-[acyl-carrier protein] synthase|uniref:Holo-[acyl-carrier-protein] synthase n=1 Tax=Candidatus Doriopsillibacter californiensis TaxID=2970740 RepID=A0ABT7QJ84_9GAMM|nr:holo-ACP synthase [Candidatus Persebacteraceae bacterium Df01]